MAERAVPVLVDVGFFGKLPDRGDFLQRRLPAQFVARWDPWLQEGLQASRADLGDKWLELYLTSPIWRFVADGQPVPDDAVTGIMLPSVDKVGRYFPLTIAARLKRVTSCLTFMRRANDWFRQLEETALAYLEDRIDFESFDRSVNDSGSILSAMLADFGKHGVMPPSSMAGSPTCFQLDRAASLDHLARAAFDGLLADRFSDPVVWWTEGSEHVRPSVLVTEALPDSRYFASLLDGDWSAGGWTSLHVADAVSDEAVQHSPEAARSFAFRSAGWSHAGAVRSENQDAWLCLPECGLWMVADGMGGHADGELASQMLRDGLATIGPEDSLDGLVESIIAALQSVNSALFAQGASRGEEYLCGSTVTVLAVHGDRAACLWAGDSRLYRLESNALHQLTADHSELEDCPTGDDEHPGAVPPRRDSNVITRAIGVAEHLDIESVFFPVRSGQSYLLCTDGLYRSLDNETIVRLASSSGPLDATRNLAAEATRAGASDNVTAVIVEITEEGSVSGAGRDAEW